MFLRKGRVTTRVLSMLFVIMLLLSVVACGPSGVDPVTDPADPGVTSGVPAVSDTSAVTTKEYTAPDVFYDFAEYVILVTGNASSGVNPFDFENTDNVLDNSVYQRNVQVEEELGITIDVIYETGAGNTGNGPGTRRIQADATAMDSTYDSCLISAYDCGVLAYQNYLAKLNDMPKMNLSASYWDANAVEQLSVNGNLFFTTGDISFHDKEYTFAVIFNKDIAKEKQLGDFYADVREGKWTFDRFAEASRAISEDLNGDDILDSRDKYGLIIWDDTILPMLHAAGQKLITLDEDGIPELTLNTETTANVLESFINLAAEDCTINFQHTSGGVDWMDMYTNEQSLFLLEYFKALPLFRDTELDYGLLPFPKFSETQDEYLSGYSVWHTSFYCIPAIVAEPEYSGAVTESLAYHSQQLVTPAYYEKTLVGRTIRDDESRETIEIIFENRTYDLGLIYRVGNLNSVILNMLRNNNPSFASSYNSVKAIAEMSVRELISNFEIEE